MAANNDDDELRDLDTPALVKKAIARLVREYDPLPNDIREACTTAHGQRTQRFRDELAALRPDVKRARVRFPS